VSSADAPSARRELTAAQHAAIRFQLVLIPAYIWLVFGAFVFVHKLPLATTLGTSTASTFRDFAHFYVLGVIGHSKDLHALYDAEAQTAIVSRVVPEKVDAHFPPIHGPQVALFFAPLARLSYITAMYVWLAVTLIGYAACAYVVWRFCPRLRERPWTALLLLAASPGLHFDLSFAQTSVIGLTCVTLGFLALRADRRFLAGLAIGSLVYKPQLGIAAAGIFVLAGEWRIVLGAIVAAVVQLGAGVVYWGPSVLNAYAHALVQLPGVLPQMEPTAEHMHSWRAFFQLLGLPGSLVTEATALASIFTVVMGLVCWRARGPVGPRYAVVLLATVLVNPHLYVYDFVLLTPAFLLLWDWSLTLRATTVAEVFRLLEGTRIGGWIFSTLFQCFLYVGFLSPLLGLIARPAHFQVSVLALACLGTLTAGILVKPSRKDDGNVILSNIVSFQKGT
jgi:hypothetical protein